MNWLNLQTNIIRVAEYVGACPTSRATWLNVLIYSCEQENGGRIRFARGWKDRQWEQTCGVTALEVASAEPLLRFEGNDCIVWAYPADKESEVKQRRERARSNGKLGGRPKDNPEETNQEPTLVAVGKPTNNPRKKRKEKEKEKPALFTFQM